MKNETLFLPQVGYPSGFTLPQAEVESALRISINQFGKNRNIQNIRYIDLKKHFTHFENFTSKFVGAICSSETFDTEVNHDYNAYTWIENTNTGITLHEINAFVVLTSPNIDSRNAFVSQSLFPFLFTQLTTTINSPCKLLSSKPIYLLCMVSDAVDIPSSVGRDFDFVSATGVMVLAPLRQQPVVASKTLTIERMSNKQSKLGMFSLDEESRVLYVEHKGLLGLIDDSGTIKGSNEKFGMLSLIPAALVANRSGYRIDYSAFSNWIAKIRSSASRTKVQNMEHVLQFLAKLAD